MFKKTAVVLFLVLAAQCAAFAQTPCPECPVEDSITFETYYPSPYGLYEELRGDKIIVGDTQGSTIGQRESTLPPPGTLTFNPLTDEPTSSDGTLYEGSLYYKKSIGATPGKLRYYDGSVWNDLSGNPIGSDGYVQYNNGGVFGGAGALYYDDVNQRVGIGTTSPLTTLEINGTVKITGGSPGADKVLTSDASGLASWKTVQVSTGPGVYVCPSPCCGCDKESGCKGQLQFSPTCGDNSGYMCRDSFSVACTAIGRLLPP